MQKIAFIIFMFVSLVFVTSDAFSARFGGGRSFGTHSIYHPSGNYARPAMANPTSGFSKWAGPLAGLAIGGLLATLFMGHGIGAGIITWLVIGGVIFLIWRLISSRLQPQSSPKVTSYFQTDSSTPYSHYESPSQQASEYPENFDKAEFLRYAKTVFIRLQASYDTKNLTDIREFTTPEVFAEIKLQLQERGDSVNQTDVVSIDATLHDFATTTGTMEAAVLFSGRIREEANAEPIAISEIWFFKKYSGDKNWLVSGIQQQ